MTAAAPEPERDQPQLGAGHSAERTDDVVAFREATRAWFAISLQTFGGPAGQIAVMQHKLVDESAGSGNADSTTL